MISSSTNLSQTTTPTNLKQTICTNPLWNTALTNWRTIHTSHCRIITYTKMLSRAPTNMDIVLTNLTTNLIALNQTSAIQTRARCSKIQNGLQYAQAQIRLQPLQGRQRIFKPDYSAFKAEYSPLKAEYSVVTSALTSPKWITVLTGWTTAHIRLTTAPWSPNSTLTSHRAMVPNGQKATALEILCLEPYPALSQLLLRPLF